MKEWLRKGLIIGLVLVLLGSIGISVYKSIQSQKSAQTYDEAKELVNADNLQESRPEPESAAAEQEEPEVWQEAPVYDDPYMDTLEEMDLAALREINPYVVGWIVIPDTQLDYPLMYSGDNQYYLEHTWKKEPSSAGSIFLEQYNSTDLSDFNTIVYGHRMLNGSMFASLKYYNQQDYWNSHPYVYILDDAGAHRYEIFSAYEASVTGSTYRLGITEDADKQSFLDDCLSWSVIDTDVIPTVRDRILTLSTCTGKGYETRWVVQARLAAAIEGKTTGNES